MAHAHTCHSQSVLCCLTVLLTQYCWAPKNRALKNEQARISPSTEYQCIHGDSTVCMDCRTSKTERSRLGGGCPHPRSLASDRVLYGCTDQVGVEAVQAVPSVGIVARLRLLVPDEVHDLVFALSWHLLSKRARVCACVYKTTRNKETAMQLERENQSQETHLS